MAFEGINETPSHLFVDQQFEQSDVKIDQSKAGKVMAEEINNQEDLLDMLDSLLREPAPFWDGFYADRGKNIPFLWTNRMKI